MPTNKYKRNAGVGKLPVDAKTGSEKFDKAKNIHMASKCFLTNC